ncbi:type I-F CRISPR-associated endoribonuclease Cas6/Csy4 [Lampropedia aestuarii]|uniref:Type I-F CRISPR-associated endoribonuclease Cas6/Csy4 n=1 Tax=Lampropedia aestuarii TaxID=2562762 RepID=A0A4S5BL64_9BURK|nr:type I-F CRISPR-associated endoribonuclease Cas6/Csy4 [Lampropedia aestuarii]MDH5856992.1 type I-F CRISPR-associated endoribonuclease Cas6/Csy4 [Lampropedia aestuarii]THJ33009.1 type I-F CRISPR-associated endoribonuclease Cas6/Csy4 [Lampropedia aestuarii]
MTSHYTDIELLPDPEFSPAHLLGALVAKLHRALAAQGSTDIAIAFPHYQMQPRGLGQVLRLLGPEPSLQALLASDWLRGMRDHTQLSPVAAVPADAEHRHFTRRQFKTNAERLRRRRIKRKGETPEQAALAIPDSVERQPNLPFVHLRSSSTGQPFQLFLALSEPVSSTVQGSFNAYGLSTSATIPWF